MTRNAHARWSATIPARLLAIASIIVASAVAGIAGPASAATGHHANCVAGGNFPARTATAGGFVRPIATTANKCSSNTAAGTGLETPYNTGGAPPLLNHGGPVMATPSAGNQVVVTPIFWGPSGHTFTASYENLIKTYLADVAADSDKTTNVFATNMQYSGSNGAINYRVSVGSAIDDTTAFPASGCTLNTGAIYADNSAYDLCLDDAQVQAEVAAVTTAHSLPSDFGHLYVIFLPKHVESCFQAGNPSGQQCTINYTASSAYCAYHSAFGSTTNTVYANMPFPVYSSGTDFSCTEEQLGASPAGTIQSPNGETDGDVEVSPLSHEMSEAITDPLLNAWYDVNGFENGDDCAYIYGSLGGSSGAYSNQTIDGHHYLTQEEFSNANFVPAVSGCLQQIQPVVPTVTHVSPGSGNGAGGGTVTITGTGFPGATSVHFGSAASPAIVVVNQTTLAAKVPAHAAGTVDVRVSTGAGTSAVTGSDHFVYHQAPVVTKVSPHSGPKAGKTKVTVTGKNFKPGATTVKFGTKAGTAVKVKSSTKLVVRSPKHKKGKVDIRVKTSDGTSASSAKDRYRFT